MPTKPDPAPTERTQLGEEIVDDLRSVVQKLRRLDEQAFALDGVERELVEVARDLDEVKGENGRLENALEEQRDYAPWVQWLEDFGRNVITREELLERTIGWRDR